MAACGVAVRRAHRRRGRGALAGLALPEGTVAVHQADTSIVPAGRSTATMQRLAREKGARLYDDAPVVALLDHGDDGVEVVVGARLRQASRAMTPPPTAARRRDVPQIPGRRVVLTADAWTNDLLAHLGTSLPLTVTREQVTYFAPPHPERFGADRLPVWIWMDDPSFYGFPTYAEGGNGAFVKAAQDCGGVVTSGDGRSFDTDPAALDLLRGFVSGLLPGVGAPAHTVTCLYTLTPDRDFVVGPVPGHPAVLLGLGAGHAFKFAPTFGRLLADLATSGSTSSDIVGLRAGPPRAGGRRLSGLVAGLTMAHVSAQVPGLDAELGGRQGAYPGRDLVRFVSTPSCTVVCTARPSSSAVMRQAAPLGSVHVISPDSTPCLMTSATVSFQRTSRRCETSAISGLRSAAAQASIHSAQPAPMPSGPYIVRMRASRRSALPVPAAAASRRSRSRSAA